MKLTPFRNKFLMVKMLINNLSETFTPPALESNQVFLMAKTRLFKASFWCLGQESNLRRRDFQSLALPSELPRHMTRRNFLIRFGSLLAYSADLLLFAPLQDAFLIIRSLALRPCLLTKSRCYYVTNDPYDRCLHLFD